MSKNLQKVFSKISNIYLNVCERPETVLSIFQASSQRFLIKFFEEGFLMIPILQLRKLRFRRAN